MISFRKKKSAPFQEYRFINCCKIQSANRYEFSQKYKHVFFISFQVKASLLSSPVPILVSDPLRAILWSGQFQLFHIGYIFSILFYSLFFMVTKDPIFIVKLSTSCSKYFYFSGKV